MDPAPRDERGGGDVAVSGAEGERTEAEQDAGFGREAAAGPVVHAHPPEGGVLPVQFLPAVSGAGIHGQVLQGMEYGAGAEGVDAVPVRAVAPEQSSAIQDARGSARVVAAGADEIGPPGNETAPARARRRIEQAGAE